MSKTILYKNEEKNTIDDYIILETIGEGTFGKVKLGIHKPTKQEVAIKILEKKNFISPKDLQNFKKEISILKKFNHPNIIKIYNIIEDESNYYIIMEYASKGELFNYIVSKKKLDEKEAADFYCQLIHGLEYIHKNGITHRDLKPENLLIKYNNILTIIDFGLSNEYMNNQLLSTPCGSPSYAAPEMILGKKYCGLKTDIWSSGIILYAMVCGHLPFEDKDQEKLYTKILTCTYDLPNFLSENCKDLIKKILCIKEKNRIDINGIKKHPFLIDSFNKYNPNEYMYYDPNKIYNKILELMINNLPEYNYNKDEIIYSIKNKKFNNITTTYELLMKKISFKENDYKSNFLFTKSSTDSFVTTNNVSNFVSKYIIPSLDEKNKINFNEKINFQNKENKNSKKEVKILNTINTQMNKGSLCLSIQTNMDNNDKIFSYYTQTNVLKNDKKKVNRHVFDRTNYKKNKYDFDENENDNFDSISKNFCSKFRIYSNSNDIFSTEEHNLNINDNNDPYYSLNSISSREIPKYKKDINRKVIDKANTNIISKISHQNNLKVSDDMGNNFIFGHKDIHSNEISNHNISEISENIILKKSNDNNIKKNDSHNILLPQNKTKPLKKKINYLDNYIMKKNTHMNKTELNKSNIFNGNNKVYKSKEVRKFQTSNLKKNKNLYKIEKQRISNDNIGEKNDSIFMQDSSVLNDIQISFPQSKKYTKQTFFKMNNFKEKFSSRYSQSPPSVYIKINNEKNRNRRRQLTQNTFELNSAIKNKSKSAHKKLVLNNSSNKKINTENIFLKNENKIENNSNINNNKNNKKKIKSNPKTYYPIFKQQSISESFNLIKVNKNLKNINIAFNPFNNNSKNNTNNIDKSNSKSNSINIINSSNNNNPARVRKEKRIVKIKTLIGNYLNDNTCIINEDEKKRNQSLSNKNLIKCNTDHIYYHNNSKVKKNSYNNITNKSSSNNNCFNDNNFIQSRANNKNDINNCNKLPSNKKDKKVKYIDLYINKKLKKSKGKYNKQTFDSSSNDFAVCNTNSSLEEINKKLLKLSKEKGFHLDKIDLKNYICSKNKNNSIKIEIYSKGNINMMKIFYLEGKENLTKDLIKNVVFSIGF